MPRRKVLSELQRAEVRYRHLLEKRDALNREAAALRGERDLVHGKGAEIREALRPLLESHRALLEEVRSHKARRNDLQARAKELIALKRQLRGRLQGDLGDALARLEEDVARMEREQETRSLSLEEENRLLEALRGARAERAELERIREDHQEVLSQVNDLDVAIDDHFRWADEAHAALVAKSERVQALRAQMGARRDVLRRLDAEGDRLHGAFLAARERADRYHRRAVEMREELLALRRAQQAEDTEGRELLEAQREAVREALEDDAAWEGAVEAALGHLRKGGKLEL